MKKILKWGLIILAGFVFLGVLLGGNEDVRDFSDRVEEARERGAEDSVIEGVKETNERVPENTEDKASSPGEVEDSKVYAILVEQKQKAEETTRGAVELITQNKIQEARNLIDNRWKELAKLRVDILYDDSLAKSEKELLDSVFKEEQESLTRILSVYEELY